MKALSRNTLALVIVCVCQAATAAAQQTGTVHGVVVDPANHPMADVLVFLDGGTQRAVSDTLGAFQLNLVALGRRVLSYRKSGYAPRSFSVVLTDAVHDVGTVALETGAAPTATLRGLVTDRVEAQPLAGAVIEVNGEIMARTDSAGAFELVTPAAWGTNQLRVTHTAFEDVVVEDEFWIGDPNETVEFAVSLDLSIELPTLGVVAERPTSIPERLRGFYKRREDGRGIFLTHEEILARNPRRMTDLFVGVRFTRTVRTFGRADVEPCRAPLVFIDGLFAGGDTYEVNLNDRLRPEQVEGIEMYDGIAMVPVEFSRIGSGCGVVVIWTR
jgi:hypothetical protein